MYHSGFTSLGTFLMLLTGRTENAMLSQQQHVKIVSVQMTNWALKAAP